MNRFDALVTKTAENVEEIFPWDLSEQIDNPDLLLLDVREPYEYEAMHIADSLNVPRGILESACEYGYEDTVPELAAAQDRKIVVICRSGNRSVLAAYTLQQLGYAQTCSLKTGLRGWNDYEQPLVDGEDRPVELELADEYFTPNLRPEQLGPDA